MAAKKFTGSDGGVVDKTLTAIGSGTLKAGFETKDFLMGEPAEEDKSEFRRDVEGADRALDNESAGYGITSGVTQIVAGLIGAGKLLKPVQAAAKGGKLVATGFEIAKGAIAGAVVIDPHEERLSNLIESFPDLQNPVTDYLAADLMDSTAEGRFKNALEGIGLDLAVIGLLGTAVRAVRYFREGDAENAVRELTKLEQASGVNGGAEETTPPKSLYAQAQAAHAEKANREAFGLDFGPQASGERSSSTLETATGTRTEAPTPEGSSAQGDPANAVSEAPRVKAGDGEQFSSAPLAPEPIPQATAPRPPIEITPESVAAILKAADDDLQAIAKYGSREAAAEAGQVVSRGARLPWQKLRGTAQVMTFMDNAASVLKSQMDAAKGGDILSDARVTTMVQSRAELFGEARDVVMGQLAEAGTNARGMVADMEAGYLLANRMFQETYDVAFKVRNGMLDEWGGNGEAALQELRARLTASADLMSAAKSISANSGRALRRLRGSFQFKPEDLAQIGTMDGQRLADLIYSTKGDPKKLAQVANPGLLKRVMDEATFSLTNSLLWLYPTHLMNLT
ncbi:hypothetical protein AB4144_09980, partial [Rhizobiaceae sp. 2RAB30]